MITGLLIKEGVIIHYENCITSNLCECGRYYEQNRIIWSLKLQSFYTITYFCHTRISY